MTQNVTSFSKWVNDNFISTERPSVGPHERLAWPKIVLSPLPQYAQPQNHSSISIEPRCYSLRNLYYHFRDSETARR